MNRKYIATGLFALAFIIGWNAFLIQRDEQMYGAYYRSKAIENLKRTPSKEIGYSPKEQYCKQQANWHPDCNVE